MKKRAPANSRRGSASPSVKLLLPESGMKPTASEGQGGWRRQIASRAARSLYLPSTSQEEIMRRHTLKKITGMVVALLFALNCIVPVVFSQANGKTHSLRGYTEASARTEFEWEAKMRDIPK